jgi:hypothetical protein
MAQVHYVIMANYDDEVVYAYLSANKGKINKLAKDFKPTEDEDGETVNYIMEHGSKSYKDGFYLEFSDGEFGFVAASEEEFRSKASNFEYGAFWSNIKDVEINFPIENAGYDEDLEFDAADYYGDEPELAWAGYEYIIGESKNEQTNMKHVPTFESFTAPQKVSKTNEELSHEDIKMMSDIEVNEILFKARELARKIAGHVEFTSPIDKDQEKKVMAKVKDVFKKEKLKLK